MLLRLYRDDIASVSLPTMPIEQHSDGVVVVSLQDDPKFSADLGQLAQQPPTGPTILDFADAKYINSSNLASLLRLRKLLMERNVPLLLCAPLPRVAEVFHVTGLDRIFRFVATLQEALDEARSGRR